MRFEEIDLADFFAKAQNLRRCIYCTLFQPQSLFNRDHIFQQQICGWDHDFYVDCVCKSCNAGMNEAFESDIANDSMEAYLRYVNRLRDPGSGRVLSQRVQIRMGDDAPFPGMLLDVLSKPGLAMRPMLQVQTRHRDTGETRYYTESEFFDLQEADLESREIRVIEPEGKSAARLRTRVMERVPSYQPAKEHVVTIRAQTNLKMSVTVDPAAARFYCKIAFNYAAKIMGADFVLDPCFNPIRNFVRHGDGLISDFIGSIDQEPLLLEEKGTPLRAQGLHLVTLQWDGKPGAYWLHAKVKPFNETCYHVELCKTVRPRTMVWSGHCINWKNREIFPLEIQSLPTRDPAG